MSDAVTPAPRERGWRRLLPALAAFLLIPALPFVAAAVPVPDTPVLLVTALAACTLIGWWNGGRASLAAVWCALAVGVVVPAGSDHNAHDWLARGWALLLAASFGIVAFVGGRRAFFGRALAAVSLAAVLAGGVLLATPEGPERVGRVVRTELQRRADDELVKQRARRADAEQVEFLREYPGFDSVLDRNEESLRALPRRAVVIYPALLALESLAALGLAWSLYHRVSRVRLGPALSTLREFRFSDQLVWGLIVGITALLLPTLRDVQVPGLNLLVFFGTLYALRGLGVLAWFLSPTRSLTGVLVGVALFLVLGDRAAFALGLVGVGDTWLDWRSKARQT